MPRIYLYCIPHHNSLGSGIAANITIPHVSLPVWYHDITSGMPQLSAVDLAISLESWALSGGNGGYLYNQVGRSLNLEVDPALGCMATTDIRLHWKMEILWCRDCWRIWRSNNGVIGDHIRTMHMGGFIFYFELYNNQNVFIMIFTQYRCRSSCEKIMNGEISTVHTN